VDSQGNVDNLPFMESVETLCRKHGVDVAHASHVADSALSLFDGSAPALMLDARARELLYAAAWLHNVGLNIDVATHHHIGRDIVLASRLKGYSPRERVMLACMVAFHRKKVEPDTEPAFNALDGKTQALTLTLSALLRLADGCDDSQSQTSQVRAFEQDKGVWRLQLTGPYSHKDAARVSEKADLWQTRIGPLDAAGRLTDPGLHEDMSLGQAARQVMRYHIDQVDRGLWTPIARDADNSAALPGEKKIKRLRVIVRRLRTDLRVFDGALRKKQQRMFETGLKTLANRLGAVRELDLLLAALDAYEHASDDDISDALLPLREAWDKSRERARAALAAHFASGTYHDWVDEVFALLDSDQHDRTPDVGQPSRIRHVAMCWYWQHVAAVQAYDTLPEQSNPDHLHALRISVKRLRYMTDAVSSVLPGVDVMTLNERCVALQDALGVLNDAHTIATHSEALIATERGSRRVALRGVVAFAEAQRQVITTAMPGWRAPFDALLAQTRCVNPSV
jgi:CHAD domain-containing protein